MRWLLALLLAPAVALAQVPMTAWTYQSYMQQSAWQTFGPGAPVATLAAQIHQESAWKIDAVSWAGAKGLGQFMPGTAKDAAHRWPDICSPANQLDPEWSIRCRDRFLKSLIVASRNDRTTECDDWAFGLRAYNGGLTWIRRDRAAAQAQCADPDSWIEVMPFNAGRRESAYRENTEYPVRIFKLEPRYSIWGRELECLE